MILATQSDSRKNLLTTGVLLLFLLAGGWLRCSRLEVFAPNVDEVMHLRIAEGRDLREVWQFSLLETHPPLGHFFRYVWNQVFQPRDIAAARWPSVLLGLLAIPVYFGLGREVGGRVGGLFAAWIAAFGYLPLVQSLLVRNYALFALEIGVVFWMFLRLRKRWSWPGLAVYGVFAVLAVLTHFGGVLLVTAMTLALAWELWRSRRWKPLLSWLMVNGLALLLFVVIYVVQRPYLEPMMSGAARFNFLSPLRMMETLASFLYFGAWGYAQFAFLILALALLWKNRQGSGELWTLLLFLGGCCGLALLLALAGQYPIDQYVRRHLWLMAPFAAVVAAAGARVFGGGGEGSFLSRLRSWAGIALVLVVHIGVVATAWDALENGNRLLYRDRQEFSLLNETRDEVRSYLEGELRPGDVLIADFHVALYFFEGERNLYRERWNSLEQPARVVSTPLGQGTIATQPYRRYIRSSSEFRELGEDVLRAQSRPAGFRVFLVTWALTNPAQHVLHDSHSFPDPDPAGWEILRQSQYIDNLPMKSEWDPLEAIVLPIDGEVFSRDILPPTGKLAYLLGK